MTVYGSNSEYGRLTSVLLHRPGPEIGNYVDPAGIQQLEQIDHPALMREYDAIITSYRDLGIAVNLINPTPLSDDSWYRFNLMYCRDLFFMTPHGAILACMANSTRSAETLYAARSLESLGIPLLHTVSGQGRFEGADAIWLNERLVLVGIGARTNREGYEQLAGILQVLGVECIAVPSYQTRTQHLLGTVQIVDRDLALVRHEITDQEVVRILEEHGVAVIGIPENREVLSREAMNVVTIAPRTIVMTAGCPETRKLFVQSGVEIAAEIDLTQLMRGAGGLACATGITGRERNI